MGQQYLRLSSPKVKKDVRKFFLNVYIQHHADRRHRGARKTRQLNQARSKPDTADWPVRTARTFVHHYNSTQYCSTETVFLIFPFFHTNIIRYGGVCWDNSDSIKFVIKRSQVRLLATTVMFVQCTQYNLVLANGQWWFAVGVGNC